jgi:hypothetical protein
MSDFEKYYDEVRELSNYDLNRLLRKASDLPREKYRAILSELEKRGALDEQGKISLSRFSSSSKSFGDVGNLKNQETLRSPLSDPNITNDPDAPVLYSRYSIRFFSVLFSPLFAGILLAINLYRLKKVNQVIIVGVFSFAYTALVSFISSKYPDKMLLVTYILYFLGAILLEELFWNRYIGKDFKFQRQYILPALAIGIGISVLVMLVAGLTAG